MKTLTAYDIEELLGLEHRSVVIYTTQDNVTITPELSAAQLARIKLAEQCGEFCVPSWRLLSVMDLHGYTETVESLIDTLPSTSKAIVRRQLAGSNICRGHQLVLAAQAALGLTSEQVDDLFVEMETLV